MAALAEAGARLNEKFVLREPGMTENSPVVDGAVLPSHPWDPAAPALSADIPLLIGYARTEETWYDRPTPESLALDEDVLAGFDLVLVATDHAEHDYELVARAARIVVDTRDALGALMRGRENYHRA